MKINDFIGKVVISNADKRRYILTKLDGVAFNARSEKPDQNGNYPSYLWKNGTTVMDNAIAKGTLVFEDTSLTSPFLESYENYFFNEGKYDQQFYY